MKKIKHPNQVRDYTCTLSNSRLIEVMKNADIKALSAEALKEQIAAENETLQRLKFAHAVSPIENPMRIKASRKLIARLNTELTVKKKTK